MSTENEVQIEYDVYGFSRNGIHRDTGTEYGPDGFNRYGFNEEGYDRSGYDENGYDRSRFDEDGWHEEGWHRDTHTEFSPNRRTRDGSRYNDSGYDADGYDSDGIDEDGFYRDGYNDDGEDRNGFSRCDNGDCDDEYCSCRNAGCDELLDSCACVLEETGWQRHAYRRTSPTIAFEFECISHSTANDARDRLLNAYNPAYEELVCKTSTGDGAICKQDGSLPDTGVEFVTVPMFLDEHRSVLRKAFRNKFGDGSVSSWNHTKCGMHVHLARTSLSNLTLGKMLCFMHQPANVPFHVAIAGRQSTYAQFVHHRSAVSTGLPDKAGRGDKYSALNVKPYTVEFRIFRPSCKFETLLKNLCYCLAVRDFCRQSSLDYRALSAGAFLLWLGTTDARRTYRELDAWLRESDSDYGRSYLATALPVPKPKPAPVVA